MKEYWVFSASKAMFLKEKDEIEWEDQSLKSDTCTDFRIRDGMSVMRKENLGAEVGC